MDLLSSRGFRPDCPSALARSAFGLAATFILAVCIATDLKAQTPSESPTAIGYTQLDGVLTCTLEPPELTGDARFDSFRRQEHEARRDRIVRLDIRNEGRTAVLSAPLAPTSTPFNLVFVANRNVFNLFIEENTFSSSVYAVFRGAPDGQFFPGELIHMSAASGGFARAYECSWVSQEPR